MPAFLRVLLCAALSLPGAAAAQYPERVINLIIAYSPGGGTDLIARAISPYIEKYLGGGAKIAIVNRPGAGGEIGFAALANSAPDGYTIGFVNTPPLLTIPIERQAQFHWQRFDYLGNIIDDPCSFSVHADTDIRNLKQLADSARANPGTVTVGSTGVGSDDHLAKLM
jgi:tripartite-type tricarboxylate transporter receptor subunit TctC